MSQAGDGGGIWGGQVDQLLELEGQQGGAGAQRKRGGVGFPGGRG